MYSSLLAEYSSIDDLLLMTSLRTTLLQTHSLSLGAVISHSSEMAFSTITRRGPSSASFSSSSFGDGSADEVDEPFLFCFIILFRCCCCLECLVTCLLASPLPSSSSSLSSQVRSSLSPLSLFRILVPTEQFRVHHKKKSLLELRRDRDRTAEIVSFAFRLI